LSLFQRIRKKEVPVQSQQLTLAACQMLTDPDPAVSAEKVVQRLHEAADRGADVVAFPEACLCGYRCDADYWRRADPQAFADAEGRVVEACREFSLGAVLGTAHWQDDQLYNSLLVIDKGGVVRGRYAKTHLAEEWPVPGQRLPIYDLAGVPSCFIICHDVRYPELVRLPVAAGARICYFCSCESGLLWEHKLSAYRAMPIARATENDIYLVMANMPADPENMRSPSQSHGNSKIIDPDGNVLDEAGYFEERLVLATVDVSAARGRWARRALEDDTILRQWMRSGLELVERG
jgi:predicted amidohydrolase